ncbi:ATPase/histidine kinase/DNA gyrase B/HSP90 domain protein [Clostridiales bacterium oral taxon 876 str. F0540]|nr:ATPase/histidine kinase/DNA gyrase B/HSP90 domain protein [Clostridiales bacterium oral taxon 876 str. F0540]
MGSFRKSGVKGLGEIPWGTHMSMFYSEREDFSDILVDYIKAGLLNNELCLWIYNDIDEKSITEILKKSINDLNAYIASEQLVLICYKDWYVDGLGFATDKTTSRWLKYINISKALGYEGVRAIGDIGWIDKNLWVEFSVYEEQLSSFIDNHPFIVMCLYNTEKCSSFEIADVMHNHRYVLIKNANEWCVIKNNQLELKEAELEKANNMLDEAVEYNELKSEFFSNISHELKTPITLILTAIQMLDKEDKTQSKYIEIIKNNSYRLLKTVDNIIDLTKIDVEFFNMNMKNVNLVEVVEGIVMSSAKFIKSKGIKIIFDTDVEEKIIAIDTPQFERIILNLISNAVKFTKPGGNIWVNIYDKKSYVAISVKDNGIGITGDKLNIIFDGFRKVDKSLSRDCEGSGIGLSVVKSLVSKHGGTIEAASKPGEGSEFIVKLPVRCVLEETSGSEAYANNIENCIQKVNIEFSDIYL